ncbi:hypothetical protein IB270_30455 [Ensifer sp. ENS05]|uniref:hypothetical protein n=1 Tax=Ensifer sp. ENS05 TaxID=2769277 RepID=UPI0017846654|nr:hypothetical protein [Ensifer sp. ENS05]MBD9597160.1 hypothetical protein [Ensifer sp. ENS05]
MPEYFTTEGCSDAPIEKANQLSAEKGGVPPGIDLIHRRASPKKREIQGLDSHHAGRRDQDTAWDPARVTEQLKPYLSSLTPSPETSAHAVGPYRLAIRFRRPRFGRRVDPALKKNLQSGLEAIIRWVDCHRTADKTDSVNKAKGKMCPQRAAQKRWRTFFRHYASNFTNPFTGRERHASL